MALGIGPIGNLLGTVNANGALLVTLDGGVIGGTLATITVDGIVVTSTDAVVLRNTTAATALVPVQMSPRLRWRGNAWDTSASETVDFFAEVLPATAATPTGTWKLGYSLNGAAASYPLTVDSTGILTTASSIQAGATSILGWFGLSAMVSPANGKIVIANNTNTVGVGLDVTTTSTLKVMNLALDTLGTVFAGNYEFGSVVGSISWGGGGAISETVDGHFSVVNNAAAGIQVNVGTAAPTFNNGTVTAGSRNTCGTMTLTGGNTGGTVTFGAPAWTNTPFIVISGTAVTDNPYITASSATAFTVAGMTANGVFSYLALGRI